MFKIKNIVLAVIILTVSSGFVYAGSCQQWTQFEMNVSDTWETNCFSNRYWDGRYAKYYTFTVPVTQSGTYNYALSHITLESDIYNYMVLMSGSSPDGQAIMINSNKRTDNVTWYYFEEGQTYTIMVSPGDIGAVGNFTLDVEVFEYHSY